MGLIWGVFRNIAVTFPPVVFNYTLPVTQKTAYQRPYPTRSQRRAADRSKTDEANDSKFLIKVVAGIALLVLIAVGFAIIGLAERSSAG